MLAILLVASQTIYAAKVMTFGCTSLEEVSKLNRMRIEGTPFEKELYDEVFLGQCVTIPKGTTVEGSINKSEPPTLLVDRRIIPPGYIAPLADFEPRSASAK